VAAVDFDVFYETRRDQARAARQDRGRSGDLGRPQRDRHAPQRASPSCPGSSGQDQRPTVGCPASSYTASGWPRSARSTTPRQRRGLPADIVSNGQDATPAPGPVATIKWLCASVVKDAGTLIRRAFEESDRRDPQHPAHLGRARRRRQRRNSTHPPRRPPAPHQRHDHRRRRRRYRVSMARGLPVRRGSPRRPSVGAPPGHQNPERPCHIRAASAADARAYLTPS